MSALSHGSFLKGEMSANPDAERRLIARAQRGEEAACAEMLALHSRPLYHFVYQLLGNHADTDDVVQETFVRAFRALGRFEPRASFQRYLFTIASRRCLSWRRRLAKRNEHSISDAELAAIADGARSPHDAATANELRREVRRAIAKLPAQQRVALVLFEIEGWKIADIAQAISCAEATVKVHLHRARLRLRKELHDHVEGETTYEMPTCPTAHSGTVER